LEPSGISFAKSYTLFSQSFISQRDKRHLYATRDACYLPAGLHRISDIICGYVISGWIKINKNGAFEPFFVKIVHKTSILPDDKM